MDELKPGELTNLQSADVLEKLIPEIECGLNIHFYELAVLHRAVDVLRRPAPENKPLTLEQFESVCEAVHNGWWEECKRQGRKNHPDMIPYADLSEPVKEYDRVTVRRVLGALGVACARKPVQEEK